jgi:hypothetical protein
VRERLALSTPADLSLSSYDAAVEVLGEPVTALVLGCESAKYSVPVIANRLMGTTIQTVVESDLGDEWCVRGNTREVWSDGI